MIEAIACEILHLNTEGFKQFLKSEFGRMENCQLLEFTRVCPMTNRVYPRMHSIRTSNPYLKEFGSWHKIDDLPFASCKYTSQELVEMAKKYPTFLNLAQNA